MHSKDNWYWNKIYPRDGYTKDIIQELSHLHITYKQEQEEWDLSH